MEIHVIQNDCLTFAVLWISGGPVAKCDPLRGRAIQIEPTKSPDGRPSSQQVGT